MAYMGEESQKKDFPHLLAGILFGKVFGKLFLKLSL